MWFLCHFTDTTQCKDWYMHIIKTDVCKPLSPTPDIQEVVCDNQWCTTIGHWKHEIWTELKGKGLKFGMSQQAGYISVI